MTLLHDDWYTHDQPVVPSVEYQLSALSGGSEPKIVTFSTGTLVFRSSVPEHVQDPAIGFWSAEGQRA